MRDIAITVLQSGLNEALCQRYASPDIKPCPFHTVGQRMIAKGGKRPPEMCGGAWACCEKYAFALSHGLDRFQFQNWLREDKLCVLSCNDGLRPVTFLLEVME